MARRRNDDPVPDRLTAVLEELEAVRRAPGWVPAEQDVIDEPRSRVAQLPRRVAATARRRPDADDTEPPSPSDPRGGRHAVRGETGELRPRQPLVRPPEPLLGAQVAPSRLAVIGAVVLVVIAALVFGGRVLWARTSAAAQPAAPSGASGSARDGASSSTGARTSVPAAGLAGSPASPGSPPSSPASVLVVQVVGQVHRPGVVRVRPGSRVQDAVAAAGGALPGADLTAINLARPVIDGEQLQVPRPGERIAAPPAAGGAVSSGAGGTIGGSGAATTPAVVELNSADIAALDTLPGVGPVLAQRIVQWRADNGTFTSVDELGEVSGIGEKLLAQLTPLVRVG